MLFPRVFILVPLLSSIFALGLAVFVLTRNRLARVNRLLAIGLAVIALYQASLLAAYLVQDTAWRVGLFRLALGIAALLPPSWLAFALTFGERNGTSRMAAWRPVLIGFTALVPLAWIGLVMGQIVEPALFGLSRILVITVGPWGKVFFSVYLVALAVILFHLENLYRHGERMTRWKIRYLIVGVFVAFGFQIVAASHALLYGFIHPLYPLLSPIGFLVGEGLIAFALIRHRLLDVDIFVSRYVVYRSFTLALVGGYLFTLGLVAEVFNRFDVRLDLLTGTLLAIVGATALAILLMSEDVRRKTQTFIHTHFYKHKYDYRTEWMEYTHRLSKATAIPEIATATVSRIIEVMWVRQAAVYTVGASPGQMHLQNQTGYEQLPQTLELSSELVATLHAHSRQISSEAGQHSLSTTVDETPQQLFGDIPVGLVVPVAALDTLVGLLVIGPEMTGKPFGVDDRDLLAAVAAQAGALMVNARLAQEASEGRELQVLARLSAFVAHDLKNAVSTLSMLTDNAKVHMDKPEFQADVVRNLGDVTTRMRTLLDTLSSPGGRPTAKPRTIALAPTVEKWMREIGAQAPPRIRLETRIGETPDVSIDPEQFRSVLQNLVLNAIEAIPEQGTIVVETATQDGSAILTVSDTGRGMSQEFLSKRLFRPFQTTKTRGLGIGLYQCRQIVQQFGGTLVAESEEEKGTRMIVRLPGGTPLSY